ncbi:MAG: hypothetical protein ABIP88_08565 [Candidatus Binatia bacterium]
MKRNDATVAREVGMGQSKTWQTTLGELIVALTDEVDGELHDEKNSYAVVALILADLVKDRKPLAFLGD